MTDKRSAQPTPAPDAHLYRGLRFWPVWIGYALIRVLSGAPSPLQRVLARVIGRVAWLVARRDRRITLINLRLVYPNFSENKRRQLGREHFQSLAFSVFETGRVWFAKQDELATDVRIEGLQHLTEAVARGKGVLLLGGHFTTNEIAAAALTLTNHPVSILYKAPKNPLMHALSLRHRSGRGSQMIAADRLVDMIQALKKGAIVLYAPDQRYDMQDSLTLPLFGVPALTNPGPPVVARYTGCAVLTYFPRRLPDGRGYVMTFGPVLSDFPSGDNAKDVSRYLRALEAAVEEAPEQYLWSYKRYRPKDGEPDPYRHRVLRGYTPS